MKRRLCLSENVEAFDFALLREVHLDGNTQGKSLPWLSCQVIFYCLEMILHPHTLPHIP